MAKVEELLRRHLVKIEENWGKSNESLSARIVSFGRRRFILGFKTEEECLTLTLTKNGGAVLGDDSPARHNIDFEGPEDDILAMLENGDHIQSIPASVRLRVGGREFPDSMTGTIVREGAAKKLRELLG